MNTQYFSKGKKVMVKISEVDHKSRAVVAQTFDFCVIADEVGNPDEAARQIAGAMNRGAL